MLNNVTLSGRLTRDPELKFVTEEQTPVVNFTVAVDRDYTDDENGKKADFIPVVAWNGTARFIANNFGKGGALTVHGRLQSRVWGDNEGKRHFVIEMQADRAYFNGDSRSQTYKKSEENVMEAEKVNEQYQDIIENYLTGSPAEGGQLSEDHDEDLAGGEFDYIEETKDCAVN